MKTFTISQALKDVAQNIIDEGHTLALGDSRIEYLIVSPYISKRTAGRCIRTNAELNFFSEADYIIEISEKIWNSIDDETKKILVLHELMHIDCTMDDKGEYRYGMRDHDVQDFHYIIKKYGIDWIGKIKSISASVYDTTEIELGSINI